MKSRCLVALAVVCCTTGCMPPMTPVKSNPATRPVQGCRATYDSCLKSCAIVYSNDNYMFGSCTNTCKTQFVSCSQKLAPAPKSALSQTHCSSAHSSCITGCNMVFKDDAFMRTNCYHNCDNDLQKCLTSK